MQVIDTIAQLRKVLDPSRRASQRIGFVPTMGFLHQGHMALVEQARAQCDVVVLSIFVNPTQFGPNEDLDSYPRDLPSDIELCEKHGVDFIFAPPVKEIYPTPISTIVEVLPLSNILIGLQRPGHFRGVATVVTKLFNIVEPDQAFFGQKDFQQLAVIRHMVRDLSSRVEITGVPTVREADGLACSSRNAKLTPENRAAAIVIPKALRLVDTMIAGGERDANHIRDAVTSLINAEPRARLQSIDICDALTLEPLLTITHEPAVVLITAKFGEVLLIDQHVVHAAISGSAT